MRATLLTVSILAVTCICAVLTGSDSYAILLTVVNRALPLVPLVLGASWVISCGDIDLSAAGIFGATGMVVLGICGAGWPPTAAFFAAFALALGVGLLHGWLIAYKRVAPLVITLGTSFALLGIAVCIEVMLQSKAADWREEQLAAIGRNRPETKMAGCNQSCGINDFPITRTLPDRFHPSVFEWVFPWAAMLIGLSAYCRHYTLHGLRHVAVGYDRCAALLAGLSVPRVRLFAFVVSSVLAYVSAMLYMVSYQDGGWSASTGVGMELTAIGAAVIGGTRIRGGRLQPLSVGLGICLWASLAHFCYAVPHLKPEHQSLAVGLLLVLVAVLDRDAN